MGPTLPPQKKGRVPNCSHDELVLLQKHLDELEEMGCIAKPEDVGVVVENLNLTWLVNKPGGGKRVVTDFGLLVKYCKTQPSLLSNVEAVLRAIALWRFIIKADFTKAYFQIGLEHGSRKYCGIATPFKGVRVYCVTAMGLPGSESALEEVLTRVLGELIMKGVVVKNADDIYIGGATPHELLLNWREVLCCLATNNLTLSATKTVIAPLSTNILGWIWQNGTLRASPHRIAPLTTVEPPKTVKALRSFIGSYKVLSRVLPGYSQLTQQLDTAVAGKQSSETVLWTDDLLQALKRAQAALSTCKVITLPKPSDTIWIVTDGAVKENGIGATLYVMRQDKLLLAGFFSARLKPHQVSWLPCEQEAIAIAAAITHFSPYIIQSKVKAHVLTDSKACVLAFAKLCRGEFSSSARLVAFLTTASRYQMTVSHIAGEANLPSDFASRHPVSCETPDKCQICNFIQDMSEEPIVVRVVDSSDSLNVQDVMQGRILMPFANRPAWIKTQQDCLDLRRTHAHLKQGTRPQKKITNIPDVKTYLKSVVIASDGLLVIKEASPLRGYIERIVVPKHAAVGLLTALHIKFGHPTAYQLKRVWARSFYAINSDNLIDELTDNCYTCAALKTFPKTLMPQTTSDPPDGIALKFAMDVMKRDKQLIVVLREAVSSYTLTCFSDSEKSADLVAAICILCAEIRNLSGMCSIRIDPAPGLTASIDNPQLRSLGISLEKGREKNPNKNPIAEKAIQELGVELLKMSPHGGPYSKVSLALATATLNSRIRRDGLSARELWTQRDQYTGEQLPFDDKDVIKRQQISRLNNHEPSSKAKAPRGIHASSNSLLGLHPGDLVMLRNERSKLNARDKYMVISISGHTCQLRKFTKSQYRSKTYDVPISECVPLVPPHDHAPAQSMPDSESESEDDMYMSIRCDSLVSPAPNPGIRKSPTPDYSPPIPVPAADPPPKPPEELVSVSLPVLISQETAHDTSLQVRCDPAGTRSQPRKNPKRNTKVPDRLKYS